MVLVVEDIWVVVKIMVPFEVLRKYNAALSI